MYPGSMYFIYPRFIPSRTTITTRVEASYVRKKAELKTQLATANVASQQTVGLP